MSADRLVVGMGPPNAIQLTITKAAGDTTFVGTAVISATLAATRPDGTTVSLACSLSGATATEVTLTHVLATTDLTVAGRYRTRARLTVPAGELLSSRYEFQVEDF